MKKVYKTPVLRKIDLFEETAILTGSKTLGIDNNMVGGSDFQTDKKEDLWGNEDIWN